MYPSHETILTLPERRYAVGTHYLAPVHVGGFGSFVMRLSKAGWPVVVGLVEGHFEFSDDDGTTWRFASSFSDDGGTVLDEVTAQPLIYTYMWLTLSAREPAALPENTLLRGKLVIGAALRTAITIGRA